MAQIATDETSENQSGIQAAKQAVKQAMEDLDMREHREQWLDLQRRFFDLEAARLARDDEFQNIDLGGPGLTSRRATQSLVATRPRRTNLARLNCRRETMTFASLTAFRSLTLTTPTPRTQSQSTT